MEDIILYNIIVICLGIIVIFLNERNVPQGIFYSVIEKYRIEEER